MKIIAPVIALFFATTALAEPVCQPQLHMYQQLAGQYGETPLESREVPHPEHPEIIAQFTMWANLDTGTWTLTGLWPNGLMCAYGWGESYDGQVLDDFLKVGSPA